MLSDTIAAIATPLGEGGLAVLRVSGSQALAIADRCFAPKGNASKKPSDAPSHTIHYGHIERDGRVIDEVLVSVLRAPRTFTREDVVEISCHGGLLPARLVLDALLAAGARLAEAGEFTRRAFLNGRLDLAQAEAVADLIHARTDLAVSAANEQLAGKLSQRIRELRGDLLTTLAHLEAYLDFPDEDIAPDTRGQLLARLDRGVDFMDELLRTAHDGQVLRRGVRAAIVGRPNAGKSSLLNQLLGHDRAIVSPAPGTTRDTIEETASIRGVPVVFIDTAGLRETVDAVEAEGVRRSRVALERAELILHLLDASEPLDAADKLHLEEFAGRKRLLVLNKCDLPRRLEVPAQPGARVLEISCATGVGLETLRDAIRDSVVTGGLNAEMLQVMINSRHQDALQRARAATLRSAEALRADRTLELVALDLRIAVQAVGEIVGETTTEDLLDVVFSQFCIGK
jgi:tRNA modification GTPase